MKVALFVLRFPVASETFVLRQATGLIDAGFDLDIVSLERGDRRGAAALEPELASRVRLVRNPVADPSRRGMLRLLLAAPFRHNARRRARAVVAALLQGERGAAKDIVIQSARGSLGRYDAIIAHFGPAGVRAMHMRAAGLIDGPIATVFHGYDMSVRDTIERHRRGYRALFAKTERMLPISALWRERLIGWGAPPGKVRVHHMGVDASPASPADDDRPLASPLRILSVGRFTEKKGLVYAIEGVRRAGIAAELNVVGYGELEPVLRAAAALPGSNPVRFLGQLPHAAVLAEMARADVFLLPSVTAASGDMEGIPVVLMEAMMRGCIVVASEHSGVPELIAHGRSGILVEERSAAAIADALDDLGSGRFDVTALRAAARATVLDRFNNARLDRDLADTLRALAAGCGGA